MNITKSEFLKFRECASYCWMLKHRPDAVAEKEVSDFVQQIIDQGKEVELWARKLFPGGKLISSWQEQAVSDTQQAFYAEVPVLFQPSFIADGLKARIDVLERTSLGFNIYEVKGTTASKTKEEDHLWDAAFQKEVLERSGYTVDQVFLIELNKEFIKCGSIDPHELLTISDITSVIMDMNTEVKQEINAAKNILRQTTEPSSCDCILKPRAKHCPTFNHFHPQVPSYAVHDLARIGSSPKRLRSLIRDELFGISDVPTNYDLTSIQLNQVRVHNLNRPIIREDKIEGSVSSLVYPLYFLDYETYPAAVPVFDGCYPFQQVPFQYSLHIQREPDGAVEHREYLHRDDSCPLQQIACSLRSHMGDHGSVIVWNNRFEGKCNEDLALANPELADFLLGINDRFYDLADIFSKQYFVHKDFKGKYSIKKVLPVFCPELSYATLTIQDGGAACNAWKEMIFGNKSQESIDQAAQVLLDYCKLDTWAMVEILRKVSGDRISWAEQRRA